MHLVINSGGQLWIKNGDYPHAQGAYLHYIFITVTIGLVEVEEWRVFCDPSRMLLVRRASDSLLWE